MRWSKVELRDLDRLVRQKMRFLKSHFLCPDATSLVLKEEGLNSLFDMHEAAIFRALGSLTNVQDEDPTIGAVLAHLRAVSSGGGWSLYGEAQAIMERNDISLDAPKAILSDRHQDRWAGLSESMACSGKAQTVFCLHIELHNRNQK